ncbi:MAG: murein biosynthesis integral membrane protein MurJ [Bdellovibrionales bacterium]|jgi:putative peptidoglycan lipid II flippase
MSFARALVTVSGFTMLSRVAGFVRDTLTAMFLGAGTEADAFFVAQRIPNLFRSLFAEGAFSAAFVPLYTAEKERHGDEAAKLFAGEALALMIALLVPFTILIMLLMPWALRLIAPGFHDEPIKFALAVKYSTITFPYLLLISITALQSGVLNAHGRFGPGAAAPIMLNIVMISALLFSSFFSWNVAEALSWGMVISGAAQALWLAISCRNARINIPLMWPHLSEAGRKLFKNIGPGAVGAGATQINLLLTTILASMLPTGAVSYLYYADRLNQLPLGIIGVAVATTLLPILSKHETNGDSGAIRHTISRAIEFSFVLGLPSAVGLGLAAGPIVQTLFEHGAFTHLDTVETAATLSAYSLCIPAFLLAKIFASRFFSYQDTKTPVQIAIVCMVANVTLAVLLMNWLEHVGMALATSAATWLNVILLYRKLQKRGESLADETLKKRLPRLFISAGGMSVLTFLTCRWTAFLFDSTPLLSKMGGLLLIMGLSSVFYAVLLHITGAMQLGEILTRFKGAPAQKGKSDV